jgi:hypothetical protein
MRFWRVVSHKLRHLVRRPRFDEQLQDELQFHIDTRVEELARHGYAPDAARARAMAEFGSRTRVIEDTRAAWTFAWLEDLVADTCFAVRAFRRRPAFTVTAIGCLALGIGANALIFSLVNAAFLRPLPYPNADRIAMVRFTPPTQPDQKLGTNAGGYFFIREHNRSFERMGVLRICRTSRSTGM